MEKILLHLKRSNRILVASHVNPDGDAIGALIALALALDALGKTVTLYNESPIPAVYRFLPAIDRITDRVEDPTVFDTAVILDCGNITRVGGIAEALDRIPMVINIDHHVTNTRFGDLHLIDTEACATAEIVYKLIKDLEAPITRDTAVAIYTGIFTDTGSFRFSNTNRSAFSICDEMVRRGVEPYRVAKHVYGTYSLGRIKLLNLALDSIEISRDGHLSIMTLTRDMFEETGTHSEDVDGLINYAKRIEDVRVAVLIQEYREGGRRRLHVSLRSDGSVDVATIAAAYGGGGHPMAAGFNIDASLPELKNGILDWMDKRIPEACGMQ